MNVESARITLPRNNLHIVLLAFALYVTAAAGKWWQHEVINTTQENAIPALALQQLIPARFGAWHEDGAAITQPISAAAAAKAGALYTQTLERVYVDAEQRRIMLSISYGSQQGDRLQAHRPEFCYQAQGFTIGNTSDETLETAGGSLPLRRLETRRPGRSEPVSYWLTVGDAAALPGLTRKLAQFRQGLFGQVADGFLVRVSSITESRNEAFSLHDRFIADLLAALPAQDRLRLAGRLKS